MTPLHPSAGWGAAPSPTIATATASHLARDSNVVTALGVRCTRVDAQTWYGTVGQLIVCVRYHAEPGPCGLPKWGVMIRPADWRRSEGAYGSGPTLEDAEADCERRVRDRVEVAAEMLAAVTR